MKTIASLIALAALAVTLSTGAMAAEKNQGKFTLQNTVRVGMTELQPGDYKVQWKAQSGSAVKVDILQRGKVVATTDGTVKNLQAPAPYDAVITKPAGGNGLTIDEIDFGNRTEALVIAGE